MDQDESMVEGDEDEISANIVTVSNVPGNDFDVEGKALKSLKKTTKNHFKKYCKASNYEYKDLDEIPVNIVDEEVIRLLGTFSSWILVPGNTNVKKWDSHRKYVSCLFNLFLDKSPRLSIIQRRVSQLYGKITKIHEERSDGQPLVENAVKPSERDYSYLMKQLWKGGKRTVVARAVVGTSTQVAGRVNEVSNSVINLFELMY